MRRVFRRRLARIGVVLIAVVALAATVFVVSRRRSSAGTATEVGGSMDPGMAGPAAAAVDPRAEVTLDLRRQQLIGVRTAAVTREAFDKTIRTLGIVKYDETRLADINLKIEGWIRDLFVESPGQAVRRGQPLFTLYSPELLTTQQEYLLALKTREQMQQSQVSDAREYSDRLVQAARQRLALWDLSPEQVRAIESTRQPQTAMTFRSPVDGHVIEKQAVQGMHIMPGQSLYKIADLSVVWVEADVYEAEIALIKPGQRAAVTLDAYPGERLFGQTVFIYPYVAENTRTVKVRFAFDNGRGRLKPGMYANVELHAPMGVGLTIPADAVLDSGTRQLVFVAQGDGYFEPRDVKVGQRLGDRVQILEGLKDGEQVATGAAFFLDSESQLRASVQGFEPPQNIATGETRQQLAITLTSQPDPPRSGDNVFEVTVKGPDGQPLADAEVSIVFFMAAMPSMSMPAMKNEAKLAPAGNGVYRGAGQIMMAGRWDVTVVVSRGGQRLGSKQVGVVAR